MHTIQRAAQVSRQKKTNTQADLFIAVAVAVAQCSQLLLELSDVALDLCDLREDDVLARQQFALDLRSGWSCIG